MTKKLIALALVSSVFTANSQTLREKLAAREAAGSGRVNPERKAIYAKGIAAIAEAKTVEGARKVGDVAPEFTLKDALGKEVSLSEELKNGPVVLTWYRGGWCPYCNIAMAALQEELPAIKKAGATLFALTPELPDKALTTAEKNKLEFKVLTDLNHKVATDYGLMFTLIPEVAKHFKLKEYNGDTAGADRLPLAATYIIGKDGKIAWSFLHHDYHMRAEPKEIVKFLEGMD
ncbi:peroxiredoxin-like family protein [Verrucomicrobiaceae bacterium 227]